MAWTTPRTWVSGELVTAALMNTHVRDNLDALDDGRLGIASQAAGDIVYASSSTALARLAADNGKFLKSGSSAPAWRAAADTFADVSPLTTRGDVLYASSGTVTGARLAVGAAGTVLGSDGTDVSWTFGSGIGIVEGRITASSGVPVTIADVAGTANVYFTPYTGNRIALYDGSDTWEVKTFTEITISLSGLTASKPYDVFAYNNSGTVTIETLVWTNTTARATALVLQDGALVKSGATTRRYLGTVYINASGGQTDDTIRLRYIWNYYNRISRTLRVMDTTTSWTYTTATVRQMRGSTANQVEVMVGVAEVPVSLSLRIGAQNSLAAKNMWAGIGHNSTGAPVATSQSSYSTSPAAYYVQTLGAGVTIYPSIGFSYFSMLEWSVASGTTTFYGNDTATTPMRTGMSGWIEG